MRSLKLITTVGGTLTLALLVGACDNNRAHDTARDTASQRGTAMSAASQQNTTPARGSDGLLPTVKIGGKPLRFIDTGDGEWECERVDGHINYITWYSPDDWATRTDDHHPSASGWITVSLGGVINPTHSTAHFEVGESGAATGFNSTGGKDVPSPSMGTYLAAVQRNLVVTESSNSVTFTMEGRLSDSVSGVPTVVTDKAFTKLLTVTDWTPIEVTLPCVE